MNYQEAINLITSKDNFYIDLGLERVLNALERLGNPQDSLKFIHVACTNGKGSVCAMIESILRESGIKTALYTSPHIFEYTERIKVNGKNISKEDFANCVEKISSLGTHLTEFEILTIAAFLYFAEQKADIVILETGLGGRLDATNVIKNNICSVITHIDLDHTDRLGETKDKIASEKAGIIKRGCPVVTSMGYEAIRDKADKENALLIFVSPFVSEKYIEALTLKGKHQVENLALAITVINEFFPNIGDEAIIRGLKNVKHPFRFSYYPEQNLIIDTAHNVNGISALRDNLDKFFPNYDRRFIFGCLNTKDYESMMNTLFRQNDEVYLNAFNYPKACTIEELLSKCPVIAKPYEPSANITTDKLNIICGSFYMLKDLITEKFPSLLSIPGN